MQCTDSDLTEPWWQQALRHTSRSDYTVVDGTRLHYRCWEPADPGQPLLLFAHGYRGNSHWWDWIAPSFTDRFRVAALDFSGMGASDTRREYTSESFAQDLLGVLAALGGNNATVVGHSIGGAFLLHACAIDSERSDEQFPDKAIGHAIVIDSWVRFPERDVQPQPRKIGASDPYPSFAAARARYQLRPPQPTAIEPLIEHLAHHSIREVAGGWRWCFDPALPFAPNHADGAALLRRISTAVDVVYGERSSVIDSRRAANMVDCMRRARGPIAVPEAHHHVMLDQPLALIALLRTLLANNHMKLL